MKPLIEFQRIGPDAFSYQISAQGAGAQEAGRTFASMEQCVRDAGDSLGPYFASVEIKFEGMFLGACATDALRTSPKAVAARIGQHFQPA
jgi:hypothetical protein